MNKGYNPYENCFTLYNYCNNCIDNLIGNAFVDANNNCVYDSAEMKIKNLMIDVNSAGLVMPTDTIGNYGFELPAGVYNIQPVLTGALINTCNVLPVQVNVTDTTIAVQNFPLQIDSSYHDFGVDVVALSPAVPGNFYQLRVNVSNHQLFTDSASVTVTLDSLFTFDSLSIPASTINNRTYTFSNVVLPAQSDSSIIFYLTTLTTAQLLDSVSFTAAVACFNGDNNSANDTSIFNTVILSGFDPNDKRVYPEGNITVNDSVLTYTIRFQNTGNYMAQNIVLLDTLDTDLNIASLQMLSSSHNYFFTMIDANVLQISFPNINLPDSNSNEPLSHGYITYTIKLKSGLPVGTQIENSAAIYFDFNAPVITNSVYNTIVSPLGVTENNAHNILVNVYPNPTLTHEFYIELDVKHRQSVSYKVSDIAGRILLQRENIVASNGRNVFAEKAILAKGIYFVTITAGKENITKKIVFE
ncbi:MAG: T9SS type A sorting domain-containing protein [Bacteroidia bacterium]|nr:T9SS type A sorting domain-containing protein [Bacteroidia bacterium]